jgi:two-component system cell cycle response regulator DivK
MKTPMLLVVEDNDVNRKLIVDVAHFHKMAVIEADNGTDAVALARKHKPTLILMDIQLRGEMSGVDAILQLKRIDETKMIPIVAVTAFAMRGDKERILSSGCEEYLSKPFSMETLFSIIKKYTKE